MQTVSDSPPRIYLDAPHAWLNVIEPSEITNDGVLSMLGTLAAINELRVRSVTSLLTRQFGKPLDFVDWPSILIGPEWRWEAVHAYCFTSTQWPALMEGEGKARLTRFGPRTPSVDFQKNVTQVLVSEMDLVSRQVAARDVTARDVTAFETTGTVVESRAIETASNNARAWDRR